MIDRSKETTYPLREVPKRFGLDRSVDTVRQWQSKGIKNRRTGTIVFLETVQGTTGRETSKEAYARFLAKLD